MIAAVLEQLAELVNADAGLVRRGRYLSTTVLVETGATAWLVSVHEGRVTRVERGWLAGTLLVARVRVLEYLDAQEAA